MYIQQNIGTDLDPNYLTLMVFLKELIEKIVFGKKNSRQQRKHITQHAELTSALSILKLQENASENVC